MKLVLIILISILLSISCTQKQIKSVLSETVVTEIPKKIESKKSDVNKEFNVEISEEFVGVYLPIEYIENISKNKNHSQAIHSENAKYHNLLNVKNNIIYSDVKWHDGYAIKKIDNDNFKYLIEKNEHIIVDNNGYSYKMISKDTINAYNVIDEYIIKIILNNLILQNKIQLVGNIIVINGKQFEVCLDDMFFPKDNSLILFNREDKLYIGLKIIDKQYVFYKIISDSEGPRSINSDEIVFEIIEE